LAKPHTLKEAIGYDDIDLLPNFSDIESRTEGISLKTKISQHVEIDYPLILSPMDTVSSVESCIAMNKMGVMGVLHRFMSLKERIEKTKKIKEESGKVCIAISLQDNNSVLRELNTIEPDLFFLDIANGLMKKCFTYIQEYKYNINFPDLITGNTLTMESVLKHLECGSNGIRNGIGIGGNCVTTKNTGIGCPALTANYYAWKARKQWLHIRGSVIKNDYPTILTDGGIRQPSDLVKAIASGADAVISGRIFAGCKETPGKVVWDEETNKEYKRYRGMASRSIQEEVGKKHIYVEGDEYLVPYTGKSVCDVVEEYCDGLRSALSYFGFTNLEQLKGAIWEDRVIAIRKTPNSLYESGAHGRSKHDQ